MKKKDLDKFKKILEDEKRKVSRHLEELSESAEEEMETSTGDPADIASIEISQQNLAKLGKREKYLLGKIEYAQKKIDDGTYGECESCGEEISTARLMARPVAQLCIDCKTEQENVERKFSNREPSDEDGDDSSDEGDESE